MVFVDLAVTEATAELGEAETEGPSPPRSFTPASTCIARVDYDAQSHTAYVTFQKGGSITIAQFPEIEFERWSQAPSAGGYWNAFLKGKY